jgi:hypothetical protein
MRLFSCPRLLCRGKPMAPTNPLIQMNNKGRRSDPGWSTGIQRVITRLLAAISAMILVATPLSAKADLRFDASQHWPLINTGSAKCFEPTGSSSDWAGLPIQQRTCSPNVIRPQGTNDRPIQWYWFQSQGYVPFNDQEWRFPCPGCIDIHENETIGYLIRNLDTNLCLDVRDGSKSDWAVVQQWTCDKNARSMLWYVEPGDFTGMFKVRNFNSDRCLDVKGGSSEEWAQLQQYHCIGTNLAQNFSQKFPPFWPVVDLNGRWTDGTTINGSIRSAVIYSGLGSIVIDMSDFNRPAARGKFFAENFFSVNFPDDANSEGFVSPTTLTRIGWSNGSVWTKKP